MAKNLVIVESPTKVKTIKKFLGKNYEVVASNGHVRDLPKSQLGIDPDNDFEPRYITIRGKGDLLASLRKEVKKADHIYLATDPDREGEAISWHLTKALKLEDKSYSRITFNEITKNAVKSSFKNPRDIDMKLVDAQQARRILDRMVGYRISPLLWAKVKRGLSAGRVQSVTLRIICDREAEINAFIPKEYYTLDVELSVKGAKKPIVASFYGDKNGKMDISDKATLDEIMKACEKESFRVISSKKSKREKKKPLPFTTSTLQQEASKALNFSLQKTMQVAQQLYEGVDIKGSGTVGLITYLRTDSVRISEEAKADAKAFITETFGAEFSDDTDISTKKSKKNIQDAHEAIRPANLHLIPSEIKESLSRDQFRLYQLIWRRFMASQMSSAEYETTTVRVGAGDYVFSLATSKRIFDGFMSVYVSADDEEEDKNAVTESLNEESVLTLKEFQEKQHFTQPPAHFTEASLVHTLEELGIGRPSTYSPTITVLLKRRYIGKEGRSIFVTELGDVVNDIMKESFPTIVDESFTANMESLLDGVEEGDVDWKSIVRNFYPDLEESVKIAEEQLQKVEISDEVTDVICENCGRNMVIKYGPHGKFLACPGFPDCRNTKPYLEKIGVSCPKCGKDIVVRKTKKGRRFYGCEDYPECDFMSWPRPVADKCPKCGGYMVQKGNRIVCANEQCGYIAESKS
ncbi:MAG: type I DNA topoisomerase [Lachnospiraceae bacterium]|nr:type I DNA topoisomerase [Lachnospiraceae bacterium]MBQ1607963.1 type I DNA topoisomerase [Lachnospiraceae bacterium]MBQ2317199.1 type I DNA topoisomerase [Lachnospiraceae bacterium]MBQ2502996.1 type I DNA topoisomerase [Lachnospiraceae bacterium]MBQ2579522.1 type I DNA topoisomerase [Lachnospiraceae bacterium]